MKKGLYLECSSGISGDMSVAALLDLGADPEKLREALDSLPLDGYDINITRVSKSGIDACDFDVRLEKPYENHDHDMNYLHGANGHTHSHGHGAPAHTHSADGHSHSHGHDAHTHTLSADDHSHSHGHDVHLHTHSADDPSHSHRDVAHLHTHSADGHSHSHGNDTHSHTHSADGHSHGHGAHVHRNLQDVLTILRGGSLTPGALALAEKIFGILAEGEAAAHGVSLEQVHFHEVGAVDSIVDIAAFAVCMDLLGYTEVFVPVLCEGRGTVRCQHGLLPVPVPAVANIARSHGLPLRILSASGEFVTPTGAAIAAAVSTSERLPDSFRILRIGIGAGKRQYEIPGILRAMEIAF